MRKPTATLRPERTRTTRGPDGFLGHLRALALPYWNSDERWRARALLAAIVALSLGTVVISVLINRWQASFYNALVAHRVDLFLKQIGTFVALASLYIAMAVYQLYLTQMLQIRWRRWLTEAFLAEWLGAGAYYRMELTDPGTDNPDQRISEDLRAFVDVTLTLGLGLLNAVATLGGFVVILWGLSGRLTLTFWGLSVGVRGYLVWAALLYALAGSYLAHRIGRPLILLNFEQQRFEADFRFGLVRVRENAEAIAFYAGEPDEKAALLRRFGAVFRNWWQIMQAQKRLTWFTSGYAQVSVIFPVLLVSPRYFLRLIEFGVLVQTASAFSQVEGSLSWFVQAYASLAQGKAVVDRLIGFRRARGRVAAAGTPAGLEVVRYPEARVALEAVTVRLPDGRELLRDVGLELRPGESLLVAGESGLGKSTLFRVLAGIWPYGEGRVVLPAEGRLLFLPQRPYLPLGTLAEVVCYPSRPEKFGAGEVREVLALCGLERFAPLLPETQAWSLQLSGGEQQRIAFARALLHRPDWLFLDEATSAVDPEGEERLYAVLAERLPGAALASIGHRPAIARFHGRRMRLERTADGRVSIEEVGSDPADPETR